MRSHRFHRHLHLDYLFDRAVCLIIVAMYVLRRKDKIAAHDVFRYNTECTSFTTSFQISNLFDLVLGLAVSRV